MAAGANFTVDLETTAETREQMVSKIVVIKAVSSDNIGVNSRLVIKGLIPLAVYPRVLSSVQP